MNRDCELAIYQLISQFTRTIYTEYKHEINVADWLEIPYFNPTHITDYTVQHMVCQAANSWTLHIKHVPHILSKAHPSSPQKELIG